MSACLRNPDRDGLLIVGPCGQAWKLWCETYGERFLANQKDSFLRDILRSEKFYWRLSGADKVSGKVAAIIYLPKRELFAAKKFQSEKVFHTELILSNLRVFRCEKVVAKSLLITIIALPR